MTRLFPKKNVYYTVFVNTKLKRSSSVHYSTLQRPQNSPFPDHRLLGERFVAHLEQLQDFRVAQSARRADVRQLCRVLAELSGQVPWTDHRTV